MEFLRNYFEHYLVLLSGYPLVIQIAIVMIAINVVITVFFFLFTFLYRRKREKKDKIIKQLYPETIDFLENILISIKPYSQEEIRNTFEKKFDKLKDKSYVAILPSLVDLVTKHPSYLDAINYDNLIKGLKIDAQLEKKLDFSNTRERLRAFQTLSRLNLIVSDSKILPYTYSKNNTLRKESRASYLAISNNDPFKFFDRDNPELNYWDQISLLNQLEMHHGDNLPNFSKWIKYSKDKSQTIFLIRAVAYFKQIHSVDVLKELLSSEDHEIRREVILTLGKMKIATVENDLKNMYYNQPAECQNAIIEAIALLQSGKSLNFLKDAYYHTTNLDTKKLIAEAIYLYGSEGKMYFENLCKIEVGFNALILQHVKNPMIHSQLKENLLHQENDIPNFSFA